MNHLVKRVDAAGLRPDRGTKLVQILAVALLLSSLAVGSDPGVALAEIPVRVYHSPGDDGFFNWEPGGPTDPTDPTALAESAVLPFRTSIELDVWYWNGDQASVPTCLNDQSVSVTCVCFKGQGDEVCGYDVAIAAVGDVTLESFNPEIGTGDPVVFSLSGDKKLLLANRIDTTPPAARRRIGRLVVAATGGGSSRCRVGRSPARISRPR
jgi:hypothetical protein